VLLEASPPLAEQLNGARRGSPLRGFPGLPGHIRQSWGEGWALVGDAGYFKDPITAHGITDALRDAELLARAIARGTHDALSEYQVTRDALSRGLFQLTDAIASLEWDLEAVKALHLDLSREMGKEVEALNALDPSKAVA
jgi:flavin-dependent dehydrogenase